MPKFWRKLAQGWCGFIVLTLWGFPAYTAPGLDVNSRLAAGEIIFSTEAVPGSASKKGTATGVVAAPPAKVWQVIIDANHLQEFLPRLLVSRVVRPQELEVIREEDPATAAGVEGILPGTPPDLALYRIPGQQYTGYFYGHVDVPWPFWDRWYIVRVVWDETQAANQIYAASWTMVVGNLREAGGAWRVEPFGDQQTLLTFQAVTDPGGLVPKFLSREFSTRTLPQVIAAVRGRVASR